MHSTPTPGIYAFNFHRKNLRKHPENLRKTPENLRIVPKMAGKYGNPTVFLQPTNRKHIPLNGQLGLASSDYMYGIQRPEFSQCSRRKMKVDPQKAGSRKVVYFYTTLLLNSRILLLFNEKSSFVEKMENVPGESNKVRKNADVKKIQIREQTKVY
jgi:hypothetical protein